VEGEHALEHERRIGWGQPTGWRIRDPARWPGGPIRARVDSTIDGLVLLRGKGGREQGGQRDSGDQPDRAAHGPHHLDHRRHDAAQRIAAFNARLRDQVDLDTLTGELLGPV
jgi:hypothetical protein